MGWFEPIETGIDLWQGEEHGKLEQLGVYEWSQTELKPLAGS